MFINNNKVHPLDSEASSPTSGWLSRCISWWNSLFKSTILISYEEAKANYKDKSIRRDSQLNYIIDQGGCPISFMNVLWAFPGIVLGMAFVLIGFVFWPTENVFQYPNTWWICVLQCGFVWIGKLKEPYLQVL